MVRVIDSTPGKVLSAMFFVPETDLFMGLFYGWNIA
jgi:hypothetical protein